MARMIDLIRQSAVPANVMRSASKGALALPPEEMIEILVYLTSNPLFADAARMTLAGWEEAASIRVAQDPQTPPDVLKYLIDPKNLRPKLLPALLENPSVSELSLLELVQTPSRELVDIMLKSSRVQKSSALLHALMVNPHISEVETRIAQAALEILESSDLAQLSPVEDSHATEKPSPLEVTAPPVPSDHDDLLAKIADGEKTEWEIEHAAEIAAEEGKPFELVGGLASESTVEAAAPAVTEKVAIPVEAEQERVSLVQKIARLSVGQRVQLAVKGNKEERGMLIRDGAKIVASAVLVSPKVTEAEIENFAAMKNVQEQVLRDIARSPKYKKLYTVVRNLTNNPRCPLDLSLQLINHLMVNDLKNLSQNKNVPETLRKIATKKFKEKSTGSKSG